MDIAFTIGGESCASLARSELKTDKLYLALSKSGNVQKDRVYFLVDNKLAFANDTIMTGSINGDETRYVEAPVGTEIKLTQKK